MTVLEMLDLLETGIARLQAEHAQLAAELRDVVGAISSAPAAQLEEPAQSRRKARKRPARKTRKKTKTQVRAKTAGRRKAVSKSPAAAPAALVASAPETAAEAPAEPIRKPRKRPALGMTLSQLRNSPGRAIAPIPDRIPGKL